MTQKESKKIDPKDIRIKQIMPFWNNLMQMERDVKTIYQLNIYMKSMIKFMDFVEPLIPDGMSLNEFLDMAKAHNNWNGD